jgi:pantothenate kinase
LDIEEIDGKEIFPEKKGGILKLNKETMKEASKAIKDKGIKTSHLKELSEMGVKLPIDQPCFPIQVNAISSMEGNEKVTPHIDVSYINDFAYYNDPEEHDIRMSIMENSHKIKFLRENLNASVGEVRRIIKHCEMMNNQVEQMVSLQNQLYANLIEKKQVCGVNTRGGASTQDPDYPEDHPKRKEQEVLKKKSSAGKSPNENEDIDDSQEQDKDISISDAETEDDNNEEEESSPPEKEQHEAENIEEPEPPEKEDPQPSIEKNKKKKHPNQQKGKERDPWVQRPIPYPQEVMKSLDDARFEKFLELIKTLCLQIPLVDAIKIPPYSKYMKDIFTNKIKIPNDAIIAMLANYSFDGKLPEKRVDPGIPTIHCRIKETYVKYALCDVGAGVSVMLFFLI